MAIKKISARRAMRSPGDQFSWTGLGHHQKVVCGRMVSASRSAMVAKGIVKPAALPGHDSFLATVPAPNRERPRT